MFILEGQLGLNAPYIPQVVDEALESLLWLPMPFDAALVRLTQDHEIDYVRHVVVAHFEAFIRLRAQFETHETRWTDLDVDVQNSTEFLDVCHVY